MATAPTSKQAKKKMQAASDDWIEKLARIGYATKGIVYVIVGVLALQAAFGAGGSTEGTRGAIREIGDEPFGQILLVLTAIGLLGYSLWRFVQAALDVEREGSDAEGIGKRIGYAISGLAYVFLAWTAASIVFGWGSSGSGNSRQEWTATLMAQPFGRWIVGIIGVVIIGVGLHHFYRAYKAKFMEEYKTGMMERKEEKWARRIGQFGLSARGIVFCLIGTFFIQAALQAQPSEAQGLSGALETLAAQPYGPWLLGLVAAGLVAYGVYCFSRARYRYFPTE